MIESPADLPVPLTPLAASATVVNLLLATGPFSYPQEYVGLGPVLSTILLLICCNMAYITATYMIEAISVANAEDPNRRRNSLYGLESYAGAEEMRRRNLKDMDDKGSIFYCRQKIEIGIVADRVGNPGLKIFIIVIMSIYMYGAICLKFVSGAISFVDATSRIFWGTADGFQKALGFDPYYFGIAIFGFFSLLFSFGNIENAKTLQVVTTILRFVVTILMCCGSIYYLGADGVQAAPVFDWGNNVKFLAKCIGGTTFCFIYHHSISGIIYPIRP